MPPHVRRQLTWDWFTPAEIRHCRFDDRKRLAGAARRAIPKDRVTQCLLLVVVLWNAVAPGVIFGAVARRNPWVPEEWFLIPLYGSIILGLSVIAFRCRVVFRRSLRTQMLAERLRPAVCFECRYFTEGFEGNECPNCGAVLYQANGNV